MSEEEATEARAEPGAGAEQANSRASKGVLCGKCEHLNPRGIDKCERCDSHLYVTCQQCKHRNPRVASRCSNCNHHLHKSKSKKFFRKMFKKDRGKIVLQVGLGIIGAIIAFKIIVKIAESNFLL